MNNDDQNAPDPKADQTLFPGGAADTQGVLAMESPPEKNKGSVRPAGALGHSASDSNRGKFPTPPQSGKEAGAGALFSALSLVGPVLLLLFLACQAWPDFWQAFLDKAYYCPAEANTIATIMQTMSGGEWLCPKASGISAFSWPGYIWLSCLLAPLSMQIFQTQGMLFPLVSALSAALALLSAWGLAICYGYGRRAALAAGLILLCSPIFVPLAHFSGGAALAAAFLMLSLLLFFIGWQTERSFICLPLAFVCAGFAGLTGGPFHLLLPLITSLIFLVWCGKFKRAQKGDALIGFVLLLALICGWLAAIILTTSESAYLSHLAKNLVRPVWGENPELFCMPLLAAGLGLLPWLILFFCVSWHKFLSKALPALLSSRGENAGVSMLWIALGCGIMLSFFSPDSQVQPVAVALACLAAILLGRSFMNLSGIGVRIFYTSTALILLIVGLGLLALHFSFSQDILLGMLPFETADSYKAILSGLQALPIIGGICIVAALLLLRFIISNRHGNGLIYCVLVSITLCQPVCLMLVPELAASKDVPLRLLSEINNRAGSWQEKDTAGEMAPVLPNQYERAEPAGNAPAYDAAPIAPGHNVISGTNDDSAKGDVLPDNEDSENVAQPSEESGERTQ